MVIKEIVDLDRIPKLDQITEVSLDGNLAEVYDICIQMEELCEQSGGVGLSAVQVGVPLKLFVVKSDGDNPLIPNKYGYFVNCDYEPDTDTEQIVSVEGCLSIRSEQGQLRYFHVERHKKIILKGYRFNNDLTLDSVEAILDPPYSVILQHEADHQNGILISDIGKEIYVW